MEIYSSWSVKAVADKSKLLSYTESSKEEEEKDLHLDINFDEPIDPAIN